MSDDDRLDGVGSIETKRLRLAALEPDDAEELRALTDDAAITEAISFLSTPFTLADAEALIRSQNHRDRFLGARLTKGDALIGVIGTHLHGDDSVEIGYWIGTLHQGMGYATEAAQGVAARLGDLFPGRKIIAECRPENVASWAVLTKVGFVPTGEDGKRSGRKLLILNR